MQVLALEYDDINLIADLQPEGWFNLEPSFHFYVESDFCFPIKIVIENVIVGLGSTIIHEDVAWLGHIIVHPNHRAKGMGN